MSTDFINVKLDHIFVILPDLDWIVNLSFLPLGFGPDLDIINRIVVH